MYLVTLTVFKLIIYKYDTDECKVGQLLLLALCIDTV